MGDLTLPRSRYQRIYNAVGFQKSYNFPLWFITCGALLGFCLARLQYLDISGHFLPNSMPGESYYLSTGYRRTGITLHLIGVLLGGILAVLQFTPFIRHRSILTHRIVGRIAIPLFLLGNIGAFMILDISVGGSPALQTFLALLGILTTFGILNAYLNIRRLQIDQHRAWMLRTWVWAASIITLRLIMGIATAIIMTRGPALITPIKCAEIASMYTNTGASGPAAAAIVLGKYPTCGPDPLSNMTSVLVSSGEGDGPERVVAALRPLFVMGAWLAWTIHALLVELYLWLTPAESYRLRVVSYRRQVEKGLRSEGPEGKQAGLGARRLGDAPHWWDLPEEEWKGAGQSLEGHVEGIAGGAVPHVAAKRLNSEKSDGVSSTTEQ